MKKIAIFVSGTGEATERLVKLFNEGNRLRTVLVVTDEVASDLTERLQSEDVRVINISEEEWPYKKIEVARLLKEKEINLLVLDDFRQVIYDEILEAVNGEMIRVSSPELAPREVVAALEADLRKPIDVVKEETVGEVEDKENQSAESEWAQALKIQFTPPKIPVTPPHIPETEPKEYMNKPAETPERIETKMEPMPSTWLIWSILVAVFCCFIPGIVAVIFSSQVSSKYYAGDIEGARRASRAAEIWIIVSFVLGVLSATLYLPFMLISSLG